MNQPAVDIAFIGIVVGTKTNLTEKIIVFGQMGYYIVDKSYCGVRCSDMNEAVYYTMNSEYYDSNGYEGYYLFDEYGVEHKNTFGGTFGVELNFNISKNWTANFILSKRIMKVREELRAYRDEWDYDNTDQHWIIASSRDFSSTNFGMSFNYEF